MPQLLDQRDSDFEARFAALLDAKRETSADVEAIVRDIVTDVRRRGDAALLDYTRRFDHPEASAATLRVTADEIAAASASIPPELMQALELARDRIAAYHERQRPLDDTHVDALGVELGARWTAVEAVGLYVPGGTAAYPSSVLMNALPARIAGVERLVMTVPAPGGSLNPLVLAAAHLAGIDEIYRVGGAQAVAALAYGTESIERVSKIVGPGNAYVAAAKRQVFGQIGIDMLAGPSEVLIVADGDNDPAWIAADLLAQAEHDPAAQAILITDDARLPETVAAEVERQLALLPRAEVARASWRDFGAIIRVRDIEAALPLVDRIAPEHLELAVADPKALLPKIRNAGAIFLGRHTPEVIGDYVAGSNHVLPTARWARFASGLSVLDFMKRTSVLQLTPESLRALGPAAIRLAEAEGFHAHARSVAIRLNL
jgi:histidinol dehydrogenase